MQNRRDFLKASLAGVTALGMARTTNAARSEGFSAESARKPLVVSTWQHGLEANEAAWRVLTEGGKALDAVESGIRVTEADPSVSSVGLGGRPDREGRVTLDACIMKEKGECGSVAFLQHIKHAVSVARLVLENTPHVMLAGEGALQFALANGFARENLLTEESAAAWQEWLQKSHYEPVANFESHDTIGMIALDAAGHFSGGCSTSGMPFKMHGRVGDSPIIGAALFVDDEVGAACATGHGELVMRTVGSFLVVELMRQGLTPRDACRQAIARIVKGNQKRSTNSSPNHSALSAMQVGYLAVNKNGEVGAFCLQPGFDYAAQDQAGNRMLDAESWL